MRICSVTIIYHPDSTVFHNISSYINYVEKLFIVDNTEGLESNNWYRKNIEHREFNDKFVYIRNGSNIGIAAALNLGCKLATAESFDWILTMDQDSYLKNPAFFNYCAPLLGTADVGIMAASFSKKMPFRKAYNDQSDELLFAITSGNLVRLNAWSATLFEEKLFIDEVDNDFCLRLKSKGYKIISSKENLLIHTIGEVKKVRFFFSKKSFSIGIHSPVRSYYITRNILYVISINFPRNLAFCINRLYTLFLTILQVILFYPEKWNHIKHHYKGVKDFLFGRYGKFSN